jgi:hypothetical protein
VIATPASQQATATAQPKSSQTPKRTQEATKAKRTPTKAPAAAQQSSDLGYVLQPGSPSFLTNFTHPEAGCTWFGIGGQVFDAQNEPVTSLVVMVEGTLYGEPVRFLSLTGVAPIYGPGGYEIVLGNQPVRTRDKLRIQIFDIAGEPLSEPITFDTFARCERNLILMNFVDELPVPSEIRYYFPVFLSSVIVE